MKSLIIPVYRNEENLPDLLPVLEQLARDVGGAFEVVFVVDGSPDRCAEILVQRLPEMSFRSQVLIHSRNYGSFNAIRTGMEAATGVIFAVMAADLQEPPELIREFFRILESDTADVVVGSRTNRDDPLLTRLGSGLFWWLYRTLVIPEIPRNGVDVFACNNAFRRELLRMVESRTSLVGLIFWLGFRRATVPYARRARARGSSAWTFRGKLDYLMDSLFAFSDLPIKILLGVGSLGLAVTLGFGLVVLGLRIAVGFDVPGYAATIFTILFFGALNVIGMGIIGSYVSRAYSNTQSRPLAVVMRRYEFENGPGSSGGERADSAG